MWCKTPYARTDISRGSWWDGVSTPPGRPQLLLLSHKRVPALNCERVRELTYRLRRRLPTNRLYNRTMTATTMRIWMNVPPIWKASQPSNQSTTRTTTMTQRIVPNITSTPFSSEWEHVRRHSLRGKKQFLPYLHNESFAQLEIEHSYELGQM